jgi:hypothetical protein
MVSYRIVLFCEFTLLLFLYHEPAASNEAVLLDDQAEDTKRTSPVGSTDHCSNSGTDHSE